MILYVMCGKRGKNGSQNAIETMRDKVEFIGGNESW